MKSKIRSPVPRPKPIPRAENIQWRRVDSTNVHAVGWDRHGHMFVEFRGGAIYMYLGVSRQRAVAASRHPSVGGYINHRVIPKFTAVKIS